jgi:hypothetical protein
MIISKNLQSVGSHLNPSNQLRQPESLFAAKACSPTKALAAHPSGNTTDFQTPKRSSLTRTWSGRTDGALRIASA